MLSFQCVFAFLTDKFESKKIATSIWLKLLKFGAGQLRGCRPGALANGVLLMVTILAGACPAFPQHADTTAATKRIRSIRIVRYDVFPVIPGKPEFLYRWANQLHIVTRESVIRRDLLFKTGERFDPELLAESERRLRRLAYLGAVNIRVTQEDASAVDLEVVTYDQWSTLLSYIFNKSPGRTIYGGALEEFNFLGRGKELFGEVRHELREGTRFTFRYTDPQLLGSRWTTEERFIHGPFVKSMAAQLVRPFFALDTRWAYGVAATWRDEKIRLFSESLEVNRLRLQSQRAELFAARAFGGRWRKKRIQLSYVFRNRDFSPVTDLTTSTVPDDELIHSLNLGLTTERISFKKETRLDKFQRVEDLTLGRQTTLGLGRTGMPFPKGVKRFELTFQHREAHEIVPRNYLVARVGFQTQVEKNTVTSFRLQYYSKSLPHQTVAFNAALVYGNDLDESIQFLLGGDSGLRGYAARQFGGNKRLILNLEDRLFSSVNVLTVALGGVVFVDAGNAWPAGVAMDITDLNYSVGFGLRLGYTKSPDSRVGRFDFAWPLNGGGFGISIGVDQQFSIN